MNSTKFVLITLLLLGVNFFLAGGAILLKDEPSPVIELKENVSTSLNKTSASESTNNNGKNYASKLDDLAHKPKSRKVTQVDAYDIAEKAKVDKKNTEVTSTTSTTTTTLPPKIVSGVKVAENVYIDSSVKSSTVQSPAKNALEVAKPTMIVENKPNKTADEVTKKINDFDDKAKLNHADKNNNNATTTNTSTPTVIVSSTAPTEVVSSTAGGAKSGSATSAKSSNTISTTTTTTPSSTTAKATSTSTTTTTTTTTSTTPKPKKPTITFGVKDFPDLDKENPVWRNLTQKQQTSAGKLPLPEVPYAQPSQEFNNNGFHGGRDFILPIVSMIFIIPLVIGIIITTYRRFRDCWSTRHYRRMDFLVDGMYND